MYCALNNIIKLKIVISFNSIIDKISLNKINKRQFFNCVIKIKR